MIDATHNNVYARAFKTEISGEDDRASTIPLIFNSVPEVANYPRQDFEFVSSKTLFREEFFTNTLCVCVCGRYRSRASRQPLMLPIATNQPTIDTCKPIITIVESRAGADVRDRIRRPRLHTLSTPPIPYLALSKRPTFLPQKSVDAAKQTREAHVPTFTPHSAGALKEKIGTTNSILRGL